MKQKEAYDYLINEYLKTVKKHGCDTCLAELNCREHGLKCDGFPDDKCQEKLKCCLKQMI